MGDILPVIFVHRSYGTFQYVVVKMTEIEQQTVARKFIYIRFTISAAIVTSGMVLLYHSSNSCYEFIASQQSSVSQVFFFCILFLTACALSL